MTVYLDNGMVLTGQDESDYNNGIGTYAGMETRYGLNTPAYKSVNKKAVAFTGLTIVGILGYVSTWVLSLALPSSSTAAAVFAWIAFAPIFLVCGIVLIVGGAGVLLHIFQGPVKSIYNFWDKR